MDSSCEYSAVEAARGEIDQGPAQEQQGRNQPGRHGADPLYQGGQHGQCYAQGKNAQAQSGRPWHWLCRAGGETNEASTPGQQGEGAEPEGACQRDDVGPESTDLGHGFMRGMHIVQGGPAMMDRPGNMRRDQQQGGCASEGC